MLATKRWEQGWDADEHRLATKGIAKSGRSQRQYVIGDCNITRSSCKAEGASLIKWSMREMPQTYCTDEQKTKNCKWTHPVSKVRKGKLVESGEGATCHHTKYSTQKSTNTLNWAISRGKKTWICQNVKGWGMPDMKHTTQMILRKLHDAKLSICKNGWLPQNNHPWSTWTYKNCPFVNMQKQANDKITATMEGTKYTNQQKCTPMKSMKTSSI